MKFCSAILCILNILNFSVSLENVWHSYQYDSGHKSREELVITNITSDVSFKLDSNVLKWKSLCVEKTCYMVGLTEKHIVTAMFTIEQNSTLSYRTEKIELEEPIDISLFHYWNSTSENTEIMTVIAERNRLEWYQITNLENSLFWKWPKIKNIHHINVFQIEYDYHILIINQHMSQITADLYKFEPQKSPNFWLRQKLQLTDWTTSSALNKFGPNYFLSIPQKSVNSLFLYKLNNDHFTPYKNLTSEDISSVVSFEIGPKSFIAINGLNAGIYRFTSDNLTREIVAESHTENVNYWLPISLSTYADDVILMAQRSLKHGLHRSFAVELFTYNGKIFQEHEDVPCLYFGEELGLSCLPDEDKTGVDGAASFFLNSFLGIVIPRKNRSSELFLVKTELRTIPNPVHNQMRKFLDRRQQIDDLISDQEKTYKKLVRSVDASMKTQLDELELEINTLKQRFDAIDITSGFDTAIFNGFVRIESSGVFDKVQTEKIHGKPAVLEDIVLKNSLKPIASPKSFKTLEVDDLVAERVNNVESKNLVFSKNFTLDGNVFLSEPLTVGRLTAETLNDTVVDNEIVNVASPVDALVFENLKILDDVSTAKINNRLVSNQFDQKHISYDKLFIPGNITVANINGAPFDKFLNEICLKNIRNYISGNVIVDGDITILGDAHTDFLNNLKFPYEFIFVDNNLPVITGTKKFSTLSTTEINCEETIDGLSPSQLITLSTNQSVPSITFRNLKITENLNVKGNITGEHANKFLPNPTLKDTNFINSKAEFKDLEVEGAIIVTENFNGSNFETLLEDIVYKTEERPIIEAMKQFPEGFTVEKDLRISSNSINNISLNSIITKNTEQFVNMSTIKGTVTFDNLIVEGSFDGYDMEKFDAQLVKLSGAQYISSKLIFEDEVNSKKLEIVKSFTNTSANVEFTNGSVENIHVEGDVIAQIDNFDINNFNKARMSFLDNQTISGNFTVLRSYMKNMQPKSINNINPEADYQHQLLSRLQSGYLSIKNLHINGHLEIEKINNKSVLNLGGSLWKHNLTQLIFQDDVTFGNVTIDKLSGIDFNTFTENLVFKNETNLKVGGQKTFINGFKVEKLIETTTLNSVLLKNILTKHGKQELSGPITIQGDVLFENNVTISESINNIPVEVLKSFEATDDGVLLKGDVVFHRLAHIYDLDIKGYVNEHKAQDVLNGIIYIDDNFNLKTLTTFEKIAKFEKNIRVNGKINNINLAAFVSQMVMTTKDTTFQSPIRFTEEAITDQITLHKTLKTKTVNSVNLTKWMNKAIFINKGFLQGQFKFENVEVVNSLQTDFLQNINMSTLIPLRTEQDLPELTFSEMHIFKDVKVGNSTNFLNLTEEFQNSVLLHTEQDIDSNIVFHGNVFFDDVAVLGSVNGIKTNQIVTTKTDQNLTAFYNFKSKINLDKDLIVDGLVNGIDVDEWSKKAIRVSSLLPQNITDDWVIENDLILEGAATGDGLINEIDFREFSREVEEERKSKYELEKGFIHDYINICKDLTFMYNKAKQQIFKFDYFEEMQTLHFGSKVEYVYSYKVSNKTFLLISEKKNCESSLYIFDPNLRFMNMVHFGVIAQIISIQSQNGLYLVVRNQAIYSTCKVQGTNLYHLKNTTFKHIANIENQNLLQQSLKPETFYGLTNGLVTEFKLIPNLDQPVRKYRVWEVNTEDAAFVPRGLATGLALHTGRKLIKLQGNEAVIDFGYDVDNVIVGNYTEEFNSCLRQDSEMVVMSVGTRSSKRNLLAVASHEETSVKGSLDFIKIYEDAIKGKVFHKVPSYKPSSLLNLDFNNGETLLAFMEDESVLQLYEYKGIEGFQHRLAMKLSGSKLFTFDVKMYNENAKIVGVIDNKKIQLMRAVMLGNQIEDNLHCNL